MSRYSVLLLVILGILFTTGMIYKNETKILAPISDLALCFYLNAELVLDEIEKKTANFIENMNNDSLQENFTQILNFLKKQNLSEFGIKLESVFTYVDKNFDFVCLFIGKFDVNKLQKYLDKSKIQYRENGFAIPIIYNQNESKRSNKEELILHISDEFAFISKADIEGNILDSIKVKKCYLPEIYNTFEKMVKCKPLIALEANYSFKLGTNAENNLGTLDFSILRLIIEKKLTKIQVVFDNLSKVENKSYIANNILNFVEDKILFGFSEAIFSQVKNKDSVSKDSSEDDDTGVNKNEQNQNVKEKEAKKENLFKLSTTDKSVFLEAIDSRKIYNHVTNLVINYLTTKLGIIYSKYSSKRQNAATNFTELAYKEM